MRQKFILILFTLLLSSCLHNSYIEIPPVKEATTKKETLDLAKNIDLPLVRKADMILIEYEDDPDEYIQRFIITDKKIIHEINSTLVPSNVGDSAGIANFMVYWFRDGKQIRGVWVFPYGEWGFFRPKVSPSTGYNKQLPAYLKKLLKENRTRQSK